MFSVPELRFSQKYPFSVVAKNVIAQSDFTLDNIPESILNRSKAMVHAAFTDQEYMPKIQASSDLLKNEILAFPASKILVSIIGRYELYRKFSELFSNSIFRNLEEEKDEVLIDLASELNLRFSLSDNPDFFVELNMADYLRPNLEAPFMKLVNRELKEGKVFLTKNDFARLISIVVGQDIRDSLPVPLKGIPEFFKVIAESIETEFSKSVRKRFSKTDFGKVSPESFPPCMSKLYSELVQGINVNHSGRFAIATFLASVGMESGKIVDAFRNVPNFNERTTTYQVERIAGVKGKGYSSPSCDKMRSYNLCVSNCPVSHPIIFYSKEIVKTNSKESSEEKTETNA
tara:strand:- start:363 stop:1397 length:1035 start_codon:yes stop_codon:yes gene_type:complete